MEKNKNTNYHDELNKKNILHLRELLDTLPPFCAQYFRGMQDYTASRTRIAYAYDIRVFFEYLHESNPVFRKTPIKEYPLEILDQITRLDIEEYLDHCSYYIKDGKEYMNDERGKARKLASLRSFYNYFFRNEMIEKNPAALVKMPKLHEKEIVRLDPDEVAILLNKIRIMKRISFGMLHCSHSFSERESVFRNVSESIYRTLILKIMP